MRVPTTARYRAAIVALAGVALAAGMAGVGIIAAEASPHAAPAAAPALIPCPDPLPPIPELCDSTSPSASSSATATSTATTSSTATATSTASPTTTVSSTLSATPTVTATRTTSKPTPTPTPTSTQGSTAHPPLAGFSHQSATSTHPTRVVITLFARGSKITKLTHVKLKHCTWSLGKAGAKDFGNGKRKVKIIVNRSHESTKGSITFWAVDAAHQHRVVKASV